MSQEIRGLKPVPIDAGKTNYLAIGIDNLVSTGVPVAGSLCERGIGCPDHGESKCEAKETPNRYRGSRAKVQ
jgi:hypothetical protein